MVKEKVKEQKKEEKIRWGGRVLGKTEAAMSKAISKQRPLQLKKSPSSVTSCGWSLLCFLASHWLLINSYLWISGCAASAHR